MSTGSWDANRQRCVAALTVLLAATTATGQEFVELSIKGELTPEMRVALANLLDPDTDHQVLLEAFQNAVPAEAVLPGKATEQFTLDKGSGGQQYYASALRPGPGVHSATGFLVVDESSNVARAFGKAPKAGQSESDPYGTTQLLAARFNQDALATLRTDINPGDIVTASIALDAGVIDTLAELDRDIEELGSTFRTIALPKTIAADARAEFLATAAADPAVMIATTTDPSAVQIDLPEGAVIQTAVGGTCVAGQDDWPFDVDKVAAMIEHNLRVMDKARLYHPRRAQVLVVDSGLPAALVNHDAFSRFLPSNPTLALRQGFYWPNTGALVQEPNCFGEANAGESAFGYVAVPMGLGECVARKAIGFLAPPAANPLSPAYIPDHGGLVGVIAAGGPELMGRVPALDALVSIAFARVMRDSADRVISDPPDIRRAFEHAAKRGFLIVNTSLRVTERARDEIAPAFTAFGAVGLTVAAAGNSSGLLQSSSTAFPASFASASGDKDHLIVVGGIERTGDPPAATYWSQASFSPTLVDIAAPAVNILSLDGDGQPGCFSGTSASAPQISFAAAMLAAFGYDRPAEIKRRLLATARIEDGLAGKVRDGRVLDLPVALDVFIDLIWLDGQIVPERVRLLPPDASVADEAALLKLCHAPGSTLEAPDGWIDANRLIYWAIESDGRARIWHEEAGGLTSVNTWCNPPQDSFIRYRTKDGQTHSRPLSEIDRIVPSRFRVALTISADPGFPSPLE